MSDPAALLRQIADALRASDLERAARLSDFALSSGLRHPMLYHARGTLLAAQGRHTEALVELHRADAMPPPSIATRNAIAMSLVALERYGEAADAFDAAILLKPDLAALYVRKGWVYERNGQLGAACKALEQAIALEPDHAEALSRLSFLAARRGDWDEAGRCGEAALRLDSRQTAARLSLAMQALERDASEAAELHLRVLLEDVSIGRTDRYLALGLMGDVFDRRNRTEEAFSYYEAAKLLLRNHPRRPSYTPTMFEATTGLIRYFESRSPAAAKTPNQTEGGMPHIFIMGFLRSGTTLVQQILASRDDAVALQERETLAEALRTYLAKPADLDRLWAADEKELAPYRQAYWRQVRNFGIDPAGKVMIDGMPIHTVKIPVIARLFPDATMVFVVRDPRDVVLSCYRRSFVENATTDELLTLEGTARFYDAVMTLARLYRNKLPLKLHQLRLEDVIADFDGQIGGLCTAAGLEWSETMRNFAQTARNRGIVTPSGPQLARGLNARGIGQWRRYREFLAPVLPLLEPWVERFGYARD